MTCALLVYLAAGLIVPSGYLCLRTNAGAEPIPWIIIAAATLGWPATAAIGITAVVQGKRL